MLGELHSPLLSLVSLFLKVYAHLGPRLPCWGTYLSFDPDMHFFELCSVLALGGGEPPLR